MNNSTNENRNIFLIPYQDQTLKNTILWHPWLENEEIKHILDVLYQSHNDTDLPFSEFNLLHRLNNAIKEHSECIQKNYLIHRDYKFEWKCYQGHSNWTIYRFWSGKNDADEEFEDICQEKKIKIGNWSIEHPCVLCHCNSVEELEWSVM